jgi:GNAT superfamily N-acetyltransferase
MASEADRDDVVRLVSMMRLKDSQDHYDWMYLSNPHGIARTWLAIEDVSGQVVGCTSMFPRKLRVDGTERIGSIGGGCFVDPHLRRRGIATALHRASFEAMCRHGIEFMYGPPAAHNLAALQKAGSHIVADFEGWIFPLSLSAVYRAPRLYRSVLNHLGPRLGLLLRDLPGLAFRRLTRSIKPQVILQRLDSFDSAFDCLFQRIASEHRIIAVRDCEYLAWRYLAAPSQQQIPFALWRANELLGFVALEVANERASLVDFFTSREPDLVDAALQAVIDKADALGCCILDIRCVGQDFLAPRLRSLGFWKAASAGFQVAISDLDPQAETLLNPSAWHFTMADTDMDTTIFPVRSDPDFLVGYHRPSSMREVGLPAGMPLDPAISQADRRDGTGRQTCRERRADDERRGK